MKKILQKLDIVGVVLLIAAVLWYFVARIMSPANIVLATLGAILVITGISANYRQIIATVGKRSTKYAANYVISVILVLAVAVGLNYVGQRHLKRFDVTGSGRYTLAPQTMQVVKNLKQDIEIKAFYPGGNDSALQDLLTEYSALSPRLSFTFIDPDSQPEQAKKYDVTGYGAFDNPMSGELIKFGTLVVVRGDRHEKIDKGYNGDVGEEDLTNAIIRVLRDERKKVYFVTGHGEKSPDNSGPDGYSLAKKALEGQGYEVATVTLATTGGVPADASVLVLAGAQTAPFPQEMEFINTYLDAGGGALFMMDPTPAPALPDFFNAWGVTLDNDIVLDVSGAGQLMGMGPSTPLVLSYDEHPITARFRNMTFFPLTRSLRAHDSLPEGLTVQPLFRSDANSWGETSLDEPSATLDPDKDLAGPLVLAVAITRKAPAAPPATPEETDAAKNASAPSSRLVVTGTSRFAMDNYFPAQGNGNLFSNMVNWLAQDDELISIRPKQPDDRRIMLSAGQMTLLRIITVFLLPGIVLVIGVFVVVRRRRM